MAKDGVSEELREGFESHLEDLAQVRRLETSSNLLNKSQGGRNVPPWKVRLKKRAARSACGSLVLEVPNGSRSERPVSRWFQSWRPSPPRGRDRWSATSGA